jgi:hypothetical protein
MGRHAGRKGGRWRKARAACLAESTICHLCGHGGAGEADHHPYSVARLKAMGLDPDDPQWLRPAHGTSSPCPVCGQQCNQVKGDGRRTIPTAANSRAW